MTEEIYNTPYEINPFCTEVLASVDRADSSLEPDVILMTARGTGCPKELALALLAHPASREFQPFLIEDLFRIALPGPPRPEDHDMLREVTAGVLS